MDNSTFENAPGEKLAPEPSEADLARADKWQSAMASDDVPAFAGDTPTELTKAAGKGYFEYAVGSRVNRGLTDLFNTLAETPSSEEINTPKTTI